MRAWFLFLYVMAGCLGGFAAESNVVARPNILMVIADDWAWPHAGAYGDHVVKTPHFDRVAREGILFTHAFSAAPSCTPSRAAMLTGQAPHRLAEGGNLHGFLPSRFAVYPDLLEEAGYVVGFNGKGWGPGNFQAGGRKRNPAGAAIGNFERFLASVPRGKPFCFWFGSTDPHRPYEKGAGAKIGMKPQEVSVPPFFPDRPEIRSDILDYYFEVQRFDGDLGKLLQTLETKNLVSNTLVVVSADNGWPFPRGKANLYDAGTRQPLAMRWPTVIQPGRKVDDFVSLTDLAPTFLQAAGIKPLVEMTGQSLYPILRGEKYKRREQVFVERERHANVRQGDLSYPARAIRTRQFLYIRNFRPDRWPAGDPEMYKAVGPFGDCDGSPSKELLLDKREDPAIARFFQLAFAKRPEEELFDLERDPHQLNNVAQDPKYSATKSELRRALDEWLKSTQDPRMLNDDDPWDRYPYFGAVKNP